MYFVSNKSHPRTHIRSEHRPVAVPPTTPTPQPVTTLLVAQPAAQSTAQPTSSIITRTRPRLNTSRFNMNDTFAARGRPCPRS